MKCNLVMLLMRILLSVYMFDVLGSNTQASAPRRVIFYIIRLRELLIGQVSTWPACYIFQNES